MNEIIKLQDKLIRILLIFSVSLSLIIVGLYLNFLVISSNGGEMPILTPNQITKEGYFDYQDSFEVNYHLLTDRIPHYFGTGSIGDIFLIIGGITLVSSSFVFLRNNSKLRKLKKDEIS